MEGQWWWWQSGGGSVAALTQLTAGRGAAAHQGETLPAHPGSQGPEDIW